MKKILVYNPDSYFNYKLFLTYINATMSRQEALKILNTLCDYGIPTKSKNKPTIANAVVDLNGGEGALHPMYTTPL